MVMLLFLTSLVAVSADIDLASLKPRDVVQLVLQDDSSVVAGVVAATADTVEVMNLETQTARTFSRGDLKAIQSGLSDRQIVDKVGAGAYGAWQLAPIFENASRRQNVLAVLAVFGIAGRSQRTRHFPASTSQQYPWNHPEEICPAPVIEIRREDVAH